MASRTSYSVKDDDRYDRNANDLDSRVEIARRVSPTGYSLPAPA